MLPRRAVKTVPDGGRARPSSLLGTICYSQASTLDLLGHVAREGGSTKSGSVLAMEYAWGHLGCTGLAHVSCSGECIIDLLSNPELKGLVGGSAGVILAANEERYDGERKLVQERVARPVFDTIVELRSHNKFIVIKKV